MTTYTNVSMRFQPSTATLAEARNYFTDIRALLLNSGWAASSDTGQMDEATVTFDALSTYAGYRMYYLNDEYHATNPIYMRFAAYGGVSTASRVQWSIRFGSGTDGVGNLTGVVGSELKLHFGSIVSYTPATGPGWGSYGSGYSVVVWGRDALTGNSLGHMIAVSRIFDLHTDEVVNNGNWLALGVYLTSGAYASNGACAVGYNRQYTLEVLHGSAITNGGAINGSCFVPLDTGVVGTSAELFKVLGRDRQVQVFPMLAVYKNTDFSRDAVIQANLSGAVHSFRMMGLYAHNSAAQYSNYSYAIRWD